MKTSSPRKKTKAARQDGGSDAIGAPPEPPETYRRFVAAFPDLARAWDIVHEAGAVGPLDARTQRITKLAIAIGALREGAVHAAVRKARAMGIEEDAIMQIVALAAGTLGFPSTVAAFSWIARSSEGDALPKRPSHSSRSRRAR